MANFVINQTASEIQQILNKAESPDTTPTPNSQNLVESGGVKTYVDTQVSAGASITTASFAPSALEDSTDGLTATDDAVPTSKAVFDAIDASTTKVATLTAPDVTNTYINSTTTIPFTIASDVNNIISVSNGVITPTSTAGGIYQLIWTGEFFEDDNDNSDYYKLHLKQGSNILAETIVNETGSVYLFKNISAVHINPNSQNYSAVAQEVSNSSLRYRNQLLTIIKFG